MVTKFESFSIVEGQEEFISIVDIGDYILLDIDEMNKHNNLKYHSNTNYPDDMVLVTDLNNGDGEVLEPDYVYFYRVEFYDGHEVNVRKEEIIRLLTKEEIEEFESKKIAIKYNL
jgi:hypothetical protein